MQIMYLSCNKSSPRGRFLRYSNRIVVAVLLIGVLAAQTREHNVQSIFYHSSPDDPRLPATSPGAIHPGTATPVPAAHALVPAGTFHRWGGTEHNSRLQYRVKGSSDQAIWQVELPSRFSPTGVLAGRWPGRSGRFGCMVVARRSAAHRGLEEGRSSVRRSRARSSAPGCSMRLIPTGIWLHIRSPTGTANFSSLRFSARNSIAPWWRDANTAC